MGARAPRLVGRRAGAQGQDPRHHRHLRRQGHRHAGGVRRMRSLLWALAMGAATTAAADGFARLEGHGGPVMGLDVGHEGQVASASFDNAIGLWRDGAPEWFDGHRAAVNAVAFVPGGLASGGDDTDLRLWRAGEATRHPGHTAKIMDIAVAPDGATLATASWDRRIGLWPLDGGAPRFLEGHAVGVNAVAFSPDGRLLWSAGGDGTLREWDVATGAQTRMIKSHGFGLNEMVADPAGVWLAYGAIDGGTRVVDAATGAERADLTAGRRPILAMATDPAGRHLAVGDGEGYIMVVDTADWSIAHDFRATRAGPVWALAFSPDGGTLYAGGLESAIHAWPLHALDTAPPMDDADQSFLRPPGEMENGERQFARKCSICHTLTPGSARRAGPTLHGVFGRPAGRVPDYNYSPTLAGSDIVWDEDSIDALFDLGPDHFIPGSKMPMQRIVAPQDRADLIAYLRRTTRPQE
ncbi:c-type cytochrome [Rhodobacteraceae bacterium CCMM004]|nr:c-type cytochrome [Rhodobacteraceae bacterium CCMM004]